MYMTTVLLFLSGSVRVERVMKDRSGNDVLKFLKIFNMMSVFCLFPSLSFLLRNRNSIGECVPLNKT